MGELAELRVVASDFERRLKTLELRTNTEVVREIAEVTRDLFGPGVRVEADYDSDNPREPWLLFRVDSSASIPDILKLERLWHERVGAIVPDDPLGYRLGVNPVE